jgi:CYTH domain-containing protein
MDGVAKYYETVKRRIDKMSSDENEREISAEEYAHLRADIDPATRPIYKIRYTFRHGSHLFEVDVYPEWERTAIMEVELPSRDTPVDIPDFISVVREVTGVRGYSNAAMSREFPKEEEL